MPTCRPRCTDLRAITSSRIPPLETPPRSSASDASPSPGCRRHRRHEVTGRDAGRPCSPRRARRACEHSRADSDPRAGTSRPSLAWGCAAAVAQATTQASHPEGEVSWHEGSRHRKRACARVGCAQAARGRLGTNGSGCPGERLAGTPIAASGHAVTPVRACRCRTRRRALRPPPRPPGWSARRRLGHPGRWRRAPSPRRPGG